MKDKLWSQNEILPALCVKNEMLALECTMPCLSRAAVPLKFQILKIYFYFTQVFLSTHLFMVPAKRLKVKVPEAPQVSLQSESAWLENQWDLSAAKCGVAMKWQHMSTALEPASPQASGELGSSLTGTQTPPGRGRLRQMLLQPELNQPPGFSKPLLPHAVLFLSSVTFKFVIKLMHYLVFLKFPS